MGKLKKIGNTFLSFAGHLLAGGIIFYFWQPIASWYWNYRPILGVDFYNTVSYVSTLSRNFAFRFNGWRPNWWGGYPMEFDYPSLHFYLNLPLVKFFSLPQAVQFYMLLACFLFLFFSYLLFYEIGKDRILAAVLAIASSFSIALYGALVWGGSLPYFASEFFLPLTVWLLIKFLNTKNKKWLYLSSLFLGISIFGHPQMAFSYAIPFLVLLLLFYPLEEEKFLSRQHFKKLFVFLAIVVLIGYPQLSFYLGKEPLGIFITVAQKASGVIRFPLRFIEKPVEKPSVSAVGDIISIEQQRNRDLQIAQFNKSQLRRFMTDTHPALFVFLAAGILLFFLSLVIRKKREQSLKALVFSLPLLWVVFYNSLFGFGISVFHGGWYRVFWPLPLALGILISFLWGDFWASLKERLGGFTKKLAPKALLIIIPSVIVLVIGLGGFKSYSAEKMLFEIEGPLWRQQSSAFPDSFNVYVGKEEFEKLKSRLSPAWLDPNESDYRLYEADQRVNIWWSTFFDMPLFRGYIDHPSGDTSGGFYWTDIALIASAGRDHLTLDWGVPEEMAYNNALFLIDWYSLKYLEAEHERSDSYNPLTSYLSKSEIFENKEKIVVPGWAELYADNTKLSMPIIWHPELEEYLTYYGIKDNYVSPIAHTTNTSTIGVIGDIDGYRTILRGLAAVNLNSRRVVPLQLGKDIDDVPFQSLKDMDAVILYKYDYRNHGSSWSKLEKYIKEGGKVIIDTGSEVKQTDSVRLPAGYPRELPQIFPLKTTKKGEMGTAWEFSSVQAKETEDINLEEFGPPLLDGKPWIFSQPGSPEEIKEGSRIILSNKGVPLVVWRKYGQGEVIWSGMNLPYHIIVHKSIQEAKFFENLLGNFLSTQPVNYENFEVKRKSSSQILITGKGTKGVFFREQNFPGWKASISSNKANGKLRIYRAGPTYPGFMYVVIPKEARDSEFNVNFSYGGNFWSYFWYIISLFTILVLLDIIVLNSRLLAPILRKISLRFNKKVGRWWEKEEEY